MAKLQKILKWYNNHDILFNKKQAALTRGLPQKYMKAII